MRLDKRALFDLCGYAPHAGQARVHRSKALRRVLSCGARWGKSTCAVYECVAALLEPRAESIGWVCAPTYDLAERIYRRVLGVVDRHFRHRVIELNERERKLVVCNLGGGRSELRAKSADNPDSLLGEGLDYLVVDEAGTLSASVWEEHLSQRLIDKRGWALLLSTPSGWGWFAKLHRRGFKGRDADYESWTAPSWENPRLQRAAIEAERGRLTAEAFAEQYGGEIVGADPYPCDVCGGPSDEAPGLAVIARGEELARCVECGREVDGNSRTLVRRRRDGSGELLVIELVHREGVQVQTANVCERDGAGGARIQGRSDDGVEWVEVGGESVPGDAPWV
ncbi:MAG: terminase family protein [Planctomycetes bacterium]|nr:terminase family protein [Planctomycetota bacterium]